VNFTNEELYKLNEVRPESQNAQRVLLPYFVNSEQIFGDA